MNSLLDSKEFAKVKQNIELCNDGKEDWKADFIEFINDDTDQSDLSFFYDALPFVRFLVDPSMEHVAFTTPNKRIYMNAPYVDFIGESKSLWESVYFHECLHQLWATFGVGDEIKKTLGDDKYDHNLLNIASDCVINEFILNNMRRKMPSNLITAEYIKTQCGVDYDRVHDTQYSLYIKLLEKKDKVMDKLKDIIEQMQKDEEMGDQLGGQGGQGGDSGDQGSQGGNPGGQGGQGGSQGNSKQNSGNGQPSDEEIDKMSGEEAAKAAGKAAKQAQDAADKAAKAAADAAKNGDKDAAAKADAAKNAQEAADKAKEAAEASAEAAGQGDDETAKEKAKEAIAEANKAQNEADKAQGKGEGNGEQGQKSDKKQGTDGESGPSDDKPVKGEGTKQIDHTTGPHNLKEFIEADMRDTETTKEATEMFDRYKKRIDGVVGDFIGTTKKCFKDIQNARDGAGYKTFAKKMGTSKWDQDFKKIVDAYVRQRIQKKKREMERTYSRPNRRAGYVQYGKPIKPGEKPKEDKLTISMTFYIDKSGSMAGEDLENATKLAYGISDSIEKKHKHEKKVIDKFDFKFFTFNEHVQPIKKNLTVESSGGNMSFEELLEVIKSTSINDMINVIITDAGFPISVSKTSQFIDDMTGLFLFITNMDQNSADYKAVEKKVANHNFNYILADRHFDLHEDATKL